MHAGRSHPGESLLAGVGGEVGPPVGRQRDVDAARSVLNQVGLEAERDGVAGGGIDAKV